jgi:cytochrome c biogenesis factor
MIIEIGHYALVLALALALVQSTVPIIRARTRDPALMAVAEPVAIAQFGFVALSFAALVSCYVSSDFSVRNVFENSHSAMPLIYKITSTSGNHEGSMLLWVLILTLVALFGNNIPASLKARCLRSRHGWLRHSFWMSVARRVAGLPRSSWGTVFAHVGLGITLLGIIGETQWNAERIVSMKPGEKITLHNYDFTFDGTRDRNGPNYREVAATFTVRRHGEVIGVMVPSKRTFGSRGTTTTESALLARGFSQLYLSVGEVNPDGSLATRLYYKPLVLLIWLGCVVMVIGGGLSLSDRRLRVGAPRPARIKTAMAPATLEIAQGRTS